MFHELFDLSVKSIFDKSATTFTQTLFSIFLIIDFSKGIYFSLLSCHMTPTTSHWAQSPESFKDMKLGLNPATF